MKATTYAAALATVGLLALSACLHDSGDGASERPMTGETDAATATLNDARGTNADQIRDVTTQAALSQPQFGSVFQSAAVDLASASGVSAASDGTDLTITVSRDDGSALTLNSGSDPSDASGTSDSPIAGHSAQAWIVLNIDTEGISVARATVTANDSDAADYLAVGYWMHIAGDLTEFSFTGAEIGAFADGPELSLESPASLPAQGTASYYGPALGAYAVLHGADGEGPPGSMESGEFNSSVELTADFAANTIEGCVGCRDGVAVFGTLHDPDTGEATDVFFEDSGYRLHLDSANLAANGTFLGQQMRLEHSEYSFTSIGGAWGGQLSNIADSAGDPRLVAGTFGTEATSAGGSEGAFLGSFIGTKE
ncbi:MAG: hypothetical protein OXB97_04690 [Rhodospirillales bacterium]|nr:hypothetical protein [Rhodospirillales bacterium]